ncbi:protein containing prepilin-type cleavage/methylation, N-terminal domain [Sulfurimonas gotlandica GD1]|uniref:Protein containing prepilin-type cleavage/methylation, N-terminal domain n=1 Tax=Sulfurimonas gotlandica (strain DSM 19862 / JCM 16533 / GD1) TaxID=929558 RepID=B6BM20_SULGG|nr:prepilin-type N-terminal cleavage/methylation domain-containing protein [Sulfurimonas gotlandica]EDZ61720.1 N-terminal methylation protein [Sulfurimonas gotlandica GD1]EHP29405.1 protein containing prepilin-type cleavage/methylation, N-terminal domain [Sulfurimonas gotlandica GD1]
MQKSKNAFTMIEMVFVIVILGILAAIAIPRFAATRTDAEIAKGRSDIASIRSAIVSERQTQLIRGVSTYMPRLSTGVAGDNLFTGSDANRTLLMYGVSAGDWAQGIVNAGTTDTYTITINGVTLTFTYTVANGRFTCSTTAGSAAQNALCENLIN